MSIRLLATIALGWIIGLPCGDASHAQSPIDLRPAAAKAMPATVAISFAEQSVKVKAPNGFLLKSTDGERRNLNAWIQDAINDKERSLCSGFAVSEKLLMTAELPVNCQQVDVFIAGKQVTGEVVARDLVSGLSAVAIETDDLLVPIELGNQLPAPGMSVAISFMRDQAIRVMDAGTVASEMMPLTPMQGFTQLVDADVTETAIGGPIVGADGKLVGVLTRTDRGEWCSLPSVHVQRLLTLAQSEEPADLARGRIGITLGSKGEAVVTDVNDEYPGAEADIQVGDRIVQVGDYETVSQDDVLAAVAMSRAGDQLTVVIQRGDQVLEKAVKLAGTPADAIAQHVGEGTAVWPVERLFKLEDGKLVPLDEDHDGDVDAALKQWDQLIVPMNPGQPNKLWRLEVERSELENLLRDLEINRKAQDDQIRKLTEQLKQLQPNPQPKTEIEQEIRRMREMLERLESQLTVPEVN